MEVERAHARDEGARTREEMKSEARAKEREVIDAATAEDGKDGGENEGRDPRRDRKARDELKGQVQTFGVELAQKILGRSIQ